MFLEHPQGPSGTCEGGAAVGADPEQSVLSIVCGIRNLSQGMDATMHACRDPGPRKFTSPRAGGWAGSPDRVTV